ncbi:MAG: hypothetical protein R2787_02155 [Saprospiraceae bacterium]
MTPWTVIRIELRMCGALHHPSSDDDLTFGTAFMPVCVNVIDGGMIRL